MPGWARLVLLLAALPGLLLIGLSILAFLVSLLALLLLSVPVYRVLRSLTGASAMPADAQSPLGGVDFVEPAEPVAPSSEVAATAEAPVQLTPVQSSPRRQIEVRIIE